MKPITTCLASWALSLIVAGASQAATLQTVNLQGTYDQTVNGNLVFQTTTTPFYLSGPLAQSTIDVTGSVDVAGLSAGGGSSVVYVGLVQQYESGNSFVLFRPRLQTGYLGDGTGGVGQGGPNSTGENIQSGGVTLFDTSNVPVDIVFDTSSFTATFEDALNSTTDRTINYNASPTFDPPNDFDLSLPVYPYVLAFNTTAGQTASWNVTFSQMVPEPSTIALAGLACLGLVGIARRKK